MKRDFIFGGSVGILNDIKIENMLTNLGSLLGHEKELKEVLVKNPSIINYLIIDINTDKEDLIEKLFEGLRLEDDKLCIEPSRLVLAGKQLEKINCEIFSEIENLELPYSKIGNIREIKEKFPNLKQIILPELNNKRATQEDIGDNLRNLLEYAEFRNFVQTGDLGDVSAIRKFITKENLDSKFIISSNGKTLINLDKIGEKCFEEQEVISIDLEEFKKLDKNLLRTSANPYSIVINSVKDLSLQEIKWLKESDVNISSIEIFDKYNSKEQSEPYTLDEYIAIREKMEEIVEGIDLNLNEKQRFAEVYKRIGKNIVYDTPAAYPLTEQEKTYSNKESSNCRNLKNGLLLGKCVCAGYADILRNALALVNIESIYMTGGVKEKIIDKDSKEFDKLSKKYSYKQDEDGKITFYDGHAWNKVKLDGQWYNVDATWDASEIRNGKNPKNVFKSDKGIEKDKKFFYLPQKIECLIDLDSKEIDEIFNGKHLWIGNKKIPNFKDILGTVKQIAEEYRDLGSLIYRFGSKAKDKIFPRKKEVKLLSEPKETVNSKETLKSWDLKNWNVDRKSISQKIETKQESIAKPKESNVRDENDRE